MAVEELELSVFGKVVEEYNRAIERSGNGRLFLDLQVGPTGSADLSALVDLMESKKISFPFLHVIYSAAFKLAYKLFLKFGACDDSEARNPEMRSLVLKTIPVSIKAVCVTLSNQLFGMELAKVEDLFRTEPSLAVLIDLAFDDALVKILREEIRMAAETGQIN